MYRRAEMRAYAESTEVAAIAAAPLDLPADLPSFSAPEIVAAIGHVDPVVHTIAPLASTSAHLPATLSVRPPSVPPGGAIPLRQGFGGHAWIRRRRVVLATIVVGAIALLWFAWPTPSITTPASNPQAAPVAITPPVSTPNSSVVQALPTSPVSTAPREAPPRTSLVDPVLRISSDPAGARVTVNGVGWGATPVVIRHLPPGPKTIRVTKDGYIADQRVVSFSGASAASVQLRLRRSPAGPVASSTDIRQR
jgi:hypothetical protein